MSGHRRAKHGPAGRSTSRPLNARLRRPKAAPSGALHSPAHGTPALTVCWLCARRKACACEGGSGRAPAEDEEAPPRHRAPPAGPHLLARLPTPPTPTANQPSSTHTHTHTHTHSTATQPPPWPHTPDAVQAAGAGERVQVRARLSLPLAGQGHPRLVHCGAGAAGGGSGGAAAVGGRCAAAAAAAAAVVPRWRREERPEGAPALPGGARRAPRPPSGHAMAPAVPCGTVPAYRPITSRMWRYSSPTPLSACRPAGRAAGRQAACRGVERGRWLAREAPRTKQTRGMDTVDWGSAQAWGAGHPGGRLLPQAASLHRFCPTSCLHRCTPAQALPLCRPPNSGPLPAPPPSLRPPSSAAERSRTGPPLI